MLTLNQLLKMTNLSPKVKEDTLSTFDKMSEDQKFELSQICWANIAQQYLNKANLEHDRMLEEMANGEKNYGPDDFQAVDEKIIVDILMRLDLDRSKEQISEVKKNLEQYLKKTKSPQV